MTGDCRGCGHPIGYHHAGTAEEMLCTCLGCDCAGYDSPLLPRAERVAPEPDDNRGVGLSGG